MKGMLTIFKKELARFFGDKRMVITSLILPGLLIYVLYSFMGTALTDNFSADESRLPTVVVNDVPASMIEPLTLACHLVYVEDVQEAKQVLTQEMADAALLFPVEFDAVVESYEVGEGIAPSVELYHNSASADSQTAFTLLTALLENYETTLANKFDISMQDLASEEETTSQVFALMLPMLLMMFLYSGCTAVAPESIAGEKERGTIATLLVTPIGRNEIALGKIFALSVIAVLSGASSALGTILSMPKLMGTELSGSIYAASDYLLLAVVILSTVLLLVTVISVISAFAKTTKEAQIMVMPLMVIVMFLGVMAMTGSGATAKNVFYLIPLYNSVQCMVGIFSLSNMAIPILITVLSNLVYAVFGVYVLTSIFRSEKIVFSA